MSDEGHRENDSVTQVAIGRAEVCVYVYVHVRIASISISRYAKKQVYVCVCFACKNVCVYLHVCECAYVCVIVGKSD